MIQEALQRLVSGVSLSQDDASALMEQIMRGSGSEAQIGALLIALRMKGESVNEIAGFARAMRANAVPVRSSRTPLIDTCGTGGSSFKVFNVSTAAAFVAAAAGLAVAKHGNRAASGVCGSADVLEALGVRVDITADQVGECIDSVGIGFLFARSHHPAMKHVSGIRKQLGIRTVFNLLGPLTNPAGAHRQVMGVYDSAMCPLAAGALRELGSERALVIHSEPGIDELSTFSSNRICELHNGNITDTISDAAELGYTGPVPDRAWLGPAPTPEENAEILRQSIGEGDNSEVALARRGLVALNAAAALRVGGVADDWQEAYMRAYTIIESGAALARLESLIRKSQSF